MTLYIIIGYKLEYVEAQSLRKLTTGQRSFRGSTTACRFSASATREPTPVLLLRAAVDKRNAQQLGEVPCFSTMGILGIHWIDSRWCPIVS